MLNTDNAKSGAALKGGTWPLADLATVTVRGGDVPEPGSRAEEIIFAAWKVHMYVCGESMRLEAGTMDHKGTEGLRWTGNLIDVFHFLWPVGQPPIHGLPWDEGYRTVKDWLLLNRNIVVVTRGNQEFSTKKTGLVESRATSWWVREEMIGVPAGMKLPRTQTAADILDEVRAAVPAPPPALPSADDPVDWWCPVALKGGVCMEDGPYTNSGLRIHIMKGHGFKPPSFMYERTMNDAATLRDSRPTPAPAPEPAPEPPRPAPAVAPPPRVPPPPAQPDRPAPSLLDMAARSPLSAPAPAVTQTLSTSGGASISAQARVFGMQVAEVEQENAALRRRVAELEEELRKEREGERKMRLDQQDIDSIAHRVVHLMDGATS
jgi:hypothetical protein